jgi:hypothetical protein
MFLLSMILANSHGFTWPNINLKFFKNFRTSKPKLNDFSIGNCWPCKLTGGGGEYHKLSSFLSM